MKKIKSFAIVLTVALAVGVTIFYACQKDEVLSTSQKSAKSAVTKETAIEYMEIPCVDFSTIKKEKDMLRFDSWEHYAKVIDALLEFTYQYHDEYIGKILKEHGEMDIDVLSEMLQEQGYYQFMPLYSFCKKLQFNNSAFEKLRSAEIEWMQNPEAFRINNPFDEMSLGYVQSALHNRDGDVMIGDEKFNPQDELKNAAKSCITARTWNNSMGNGGVWPTYSYDGKKREFRAFIESNQSYTYAKTSMYYFNGLGSRIVWLACVSLKLSGERYSVCGVHTSNTISIYKYKTGSVSVIEEYDWHKSLPNYMRSDNLSSITSTHVSLGRTFSLSL